MRTSAVLGFALTLTLATAMPTLDKNVKKLNTVKKLPEDLPGVPPCYGVKREHCNLKVVNVSDEVCEGCLAKNNDAIEKVCGNKTTQLNINYCVAAKALRYPTENKAVAQAKDTDAAPSVSNTEETGTGVETLNRDARAFTKIRKPSYLCYYSWQAYCGFMGGIVDDHSWTKYHLCVECNLAWEEELSRAGCSQNQVLKICRGQGYWYDDDYVEIPYKVEDDAVEPAPPTIPPPPIAGFTWPPAGSDWPYDDDEEWSNPPSFAPTKEPTEP
eukprot:m.198817 g.198817  ORF g.198817 m.198817 type:complete len:271 (+) comp15302_c0_seq1:34-846(+)